MVSVKKHSGACTTICKHFAVSMLKWCYIKQLSSFLTKHTVMLDYFTTFHVILKIAAIKIINVYFGI